MLLLLFILLTISVLSILSELLPYLVYKSRNNKFNKQVIHGLFFILLRLQGIQIAKFFKSLRFCSNLSTRKFIYMGRIKGSG